MTTEEYFGDWLKVIDKPLMFNILKKLKNIPNICPQWKDIFRAFALCPYKDLRVVFLGQDPYPQRGVATGILFGNKKEVREENLSPSLKIIKEAAINFEKPHYSITFDQTLESWAKQGILMINSALTVEENKIGSHVIVWRPFIAKLFQNLSRINPGLIYVLFGKQAESFSPFINGNNNHILTEKHPAYYARIGERMPSTVFQKVSELSTLLNGEEIKWFNN